MVVESLDMVAKVDMMLVVAGRDGLITCQLSWGMVSGGRNCEYIIDTWGTVSGGRNHEVSPTHHAPVYIHKYRPPIECM